MVLKHMKIRSPLHVCLNNSVGLLEANVQGGLGLIFMFLSPCISSILNLQTTVWGPMDPAALSPSSKKVIIRIAKPKFHLIIHHTEPFCCITWYLAYDAPAHTRPLRSTQKYLGSNGPRHLFYVTGLKMN